MHTCNVHFKIKCEINSEYVQMSRKQNIWEKLFYIKVEFQQMQSQL